MPGLLTFLFVLTAIIPLPIWLLLILFPHRRVSRTVSDNYLVFLLLGVLFIFLVAGTAVAGAGVLSQGGVVVSTSAPPPTATASAQATGTPAGTSAATAAATSPAAIAPNSPPPMSIAPADLLANPFIGSLAVLTWIGIVTLNLLAGYWIFHEAERQHLPTVVASICIFVAFLSGPVGVFFFVLTQTLTSSRREALAKADTASVVEKA
ncbi:MAG TPA: abscisic acid-deficient protein Aba4 family protein [Aggregatilineales bacterium]|nr:abscisic acid-deficient protein Aba4 family protein [Aggregatilineales bacterium]